MHYGFDIGGTKISFAAFDQQFNRVSYRRLTTPNVFSELLDLIEHVVSEHDRRYGVIGTLGIGAPGCANGGRWYAANAPAINQQPFKQQLQQRLDRPLIVTNDANCFGIAEASAVDPDKNKTLFAVTLGTGVGGSLVVNGQLIEGCHGLTGEWGHQPLPLLGWPAIAKELALPEIACNCGRQGCIDTYISGLGLQQLVRCYSQQSMTGEAIIAAWRQGDLMITKAVKSYIECLAASLAMVINFIDPHGIVLGGGLSQVPEFYPAVITSWKKYTLISNPSTVLTACQYGADSGVIGAAQLGKTLAV